MEDMEKRILGKSGIEAAPLGLGCMRLSSRGWYVNDKEIDFGPINDNESISTINLAIDMGISIFDTASLYGAGHNERLLGKALGTRRNKAIIISKAGSYIDEEKRTAGGGHIIDNPKEVIKLCEGSLKRLNTDYIDIYLLHTFYKDDKINLEKAAEIRDIMEQLVKEGKLHWYGWSTDWPHQLAVFMEGDHCTCTEQDFNIFSGNEETLKLCENNNLASFNRRPLAGGTLMKAPGINEDEKYNKEIKDILTSRGESPAQGALCWLWAKSKVTIPIPGFRTREQAKDLIGALEYGPLGSDQMEEIEKIKRKMEGLEK